jgi:hypothetical protein
MDGEWKVCLMSDCKILQKGQNNFFSGGFMGDLVFNGGDYLTHLYHSCNLRSLAGKFGMWVGNQQYALSDDSVFMLILSSGSLSET